MGRVAALSVRAVACRRQTHDRHGISLRGFRPGGARRRFVSRSLSKGGSPMATPLRVLMVEDQPFDAELILEELTAAGFDPVWTRVDKEADFLAQLSRDPEL